MRRVALALAFAFLAACSAANPPDSAPDAGELPDAGVVVPHACAAHQACGVRLDADGLCAGACVDQPDGPHCAGRVVANVCAAEPASPDRGPGPFGDVLNLVVDASPAKAVPGDVVRYALRLENPSNQAVSGDLALAAGPGFELISDSPGPVTVPAGGSLPITADLRAIRPTVMVPGDWMALWLTLGRQGARGLELPVGFSDGEIACGDARFPAEWCDGEYCHEQRRFYVSARCCDGVFYPGATCCAASDCSEGACIDGRCVHQVPSMTLATTLLNAPQRVLLVLSDVDVPAGTGPCTDLAPKLVDELHLGDVEAFFADELRTRAGREATPFRWTILGGLKATDVAGAPPYYSGAFTKAAEAWLRKQGCLESFDDYDRVIVASPLIQVTGGSTAEAFAPGRIASRSWTQPLLFAHELSHTFGATDLYLDAAGFLQHRLDLMGDNLGAFGPPRDGVMWGEIGLGDLDHDGVVDLAQFATAPQALDFLRFSATLTAKGTLEVTADVGGLEDGALRRLNLPPVWVEVPADHAKLAVVGSGVAAFGREEVDIERIRAAGAVTVRVTTEYRYTAADFTPKKLVLDETRTLAITP